jgi:hypothetical protein
MSHAVRSTMAATVFATIIGTMAWYSGVDAVVWPTHPLWAGLLLTLLVTLVVQYNWPKRMGE